MTSRVLELDKQINELRQRAQAEPGNAALRLQLDKLAQEQIEALFESSREVMEHVDAALTICRKTQAGAMKRFRKSIYRHAAIVNRTCEVIYTESK